MASNELKITVDTADAIRALRAEIEKIKQEKHPIRIETATGDPEGAFVPANETRVTVGGMELAGVQSIDVRAQPGGLWTAHVVIAIDPARDIVYREAPAAEVDMQWPPGR